MTHRVVVSVDVEGGSGLDRYRSVSALSELLADRSFSTTLFVTPIVVEARPETVVGWTDVGHEVGLHVQPARLGGDSDRLSTYSVSSIEDFVADGSVIFSDRLGLRPRSFRAGRWEHSPALLEALDRQDFNRDASLRPDRHRDPYLGGGVSEYPLSVYTNPLVRIALTPWGFDTAGLHADTFLSKRAFLRGFYAVTHRLLQADRSYVMVAFHDYEVLDRRLRSLIARYLDWLSRRGAPAMISALPSPSSD